MMRYTDLMQYPAFSKCESVYDIFEVIDKLNTSRDVHECETVTKDTKRVVAYVEIETKIDGNIKRIKCYGYEMFEGWDDDDQMHTLTSFMLDDALGCEIA